jgi:hypothetical protein
MKKILHHIFGHKLLLIAFLSLTLFFSQKNIVFAQLGMFDTCVEIEADQNEPKAQQQCSAIYQMGQEQHPCTSARVFLPNVAYCALGSNTDKPGNVTGNTCAAYYNNPPQKCHECGFMLSGTSFYTAYLCPAPTLTPTPPPTSAPPDSGPCAGPYGYYSGSAACCSYLTACPNGQCLDSCPGSTPTPTNSPGQVCTPNSIQYVCGSTTCQQ